MPSRVTVKYSIKSNTFVWQEGKATMSIQVLPLAPPDVQAISVLADTIWRHHYSGIISSEQIEYMLAQRYQPTVILTQLSAVGIWWKKTNP